MSRDNSPLHRRGAVILGLIQPRCALSRSWSRCLILRCVAVTSQRGFMLAIVATPSFLKRTSMTVCQVGNHGPIGDSWPIAFLGCPRGHKRGLFMVVEPIKLTAGQIKTLFSPEEGKRYFDFQEPVGRVLH